MLFYLIALRLFRKSSLPQDWAAAFTFFWFPIPLAILATLDSIFWRNTKTRLSLSHATHFLSPQSFIYAFKTISFLPECFLFTTWLFYRHLIPSWIDQLGIVGFIFLAFPIKHESMNIIWLLLKEATRRLKKNKPVEQNWPIRNETYKLLNPNYPLLRRTLSFSGKKTFDLRLQKNEKPHLIFIFLESFRYKEIGHYSPHFDKLAQEGILFTQFHSNGTRTSQGSIASLYGIPPTYAPSYLRFYLDVPMIGIPHVLKGYCSQLIQSSHLSFCNTADFFKSHGFSELFGKNEILQKYPNAPTTSWGVADEAMFSFAAEKLIHATSPLFLSLFTITNHHPWKLPGKKEGNFFETFSYTDWCLGRFFDKIEPILNNCIFFILADHGQGLGERDGSFLLNRHLYQENVHIPLLIYAKGRIEEPKKIEEPASQIDLLPTVLDLFGLEGPHHSLGRSLQREGSAPIFLVQPSDADPLIGLRDGSEKHIYHLATERDEFYDLSKDPEEKVNLGKKTDVLSFAQNLHSLYCHKKFCSNQLLTPHRLKGRLDISEKDWNQGSSLSLDLTDCLLLSDQDIQSIFRLQPNLEELILEGVEDLTGDWEGSAPYLTSLNLLGCPKLAGAKIAPWIASLPRLWSLKFDGTGFSQEDYKILGQARAQWWHVEIVNGHSLDKEAFFQNQRNMYYFSLDGVKQSLSCHGQEPKEPTELPASHLISPLHSENGGDARAPQSRSAAKDHPV